VSWKMEMDRIGLRYVLTSSFQGTQGYPKVRNTALPL
jgi:hypothetical protein